MSTQAVTKNGIDTTGPTTEGTMFRVLAAVSFCHLLNDMVQSLVPSIYPILKSSFHLSFTQIGLITLTYQITASLLQPFIGHYTDRKPMPYSLPIGMVFTLIGLLLLAVAPTFSLLLVAATLIGMGSAVFHPESSRVARMASGGKHGFAQSFFQVGGNTGSAIGPLLAALIVLPRGQIGSAWFSIAALLGIVVLIRVSRWYKARLAHLRSRPTKLEEESSTLPPAKVAAAIAVLIALVFSKYFYLASLNTFYTFYLIHKFQVSMQSAQIHLFVFLSAVAIGTMAGGPIGDRFGRKIVIWVSILGVLPFTLMLPYADLFWTGVLTVVIGLVLSSAFSAMVVYGQELMPGKVGMVSGLFFGFAFGIAGLGAACLGWLADLTDIDFVYRVSAFLPALGLLAALLPRLESDKRRRPAAA